MDQTQEKRGQDHVLQTPIWVVVIRGFQLFLSFIILVLCGVLMHDAYLDEEGLNLAISLLTWIAVLYILLTEKVSSLRSAYNIIAVLVLDALFTVLWLASFAAMAAERAKYIYNVNVTNCTDDGSLIDSKTCSRKRDFENLEKRNNVILFQSGLAMTAAIAGLGALVWLLFIACLVWNIMQFLKGRKEGRFAVGSSTGSTPNNNYQMENKIAEAQPMAPQAYPSQTQPPAAPFQDAPQGQYPPQYPPQGQVPYQQPPTPYQQGQAAYPPPQAAYSPQDQQNYGQYPPQQQQQPVAYGSELDGHNQYNAPIPPVSPPPQQYQQQHYPPQQ